MVRTDLKRLSDRYHRLRAEADRARLDLADAIRTEAAGGTPQVEIVKTTGYTREMIRRIVRGAPDAAA